MAVHTITAKNINALVGHEYPGAWRVSEMLRRLITRLETRIANWLCYRTTIDQLGRLSNRQLADIGILRSDIVAIARSAARRAGA